MQNVFQSPISQSRSLSCSSEFLESDFSSENANLSLLESDAFLNDLLCLFDDLEDENEVANYSSQNKGSNSMNDDIVVTSFWRHDDDERLVSESGKRQSPSLPEKTPDVQTDTDTAPCRDDDEHVVSVSGKRRSPSLPEKTPGVQTDTDNAPCRDDDEHKPGKRRSRSQPKKTRVQTDADTAPAKRSKKASTRRIRKWSKEEDARLEEGIELYKLPNWTLIAKHVKTRSNKMCSQRWRYNLRPESKLVRKGPWSEDEDRRLRQIVSKHTLKNESTWDRVSESMGFIRSNIQYRE